MIVGLGIDSVAVHRFNAWNKMPEKQLLRIFSPTEIAYCLEHPLLFNQRFAVRFAAREATFKALYHYKPSCSVPFLLLCKAVKVLKKENFLPHLSIDWPRLLPDCQDFFPTAHLSLCHTAEMASAIVILEQK